MKLLATFLLLATQFVFSQSFKIEENIKLPNRVNETSGLIYLNKELVTFNDSGGKPELYIINPKSGKIKRTVRIQNAKNVDWESIAEDETAIYIGDTGNNYGSRKDLTIYKIYKKDFFRKNAVLAEKIHFSYRNQSNFKKKKHHTNFDCESITIYNNQILLFTKNWKNKKTNVYKVPLIKGVYKAIKIKKLNINCLLTSIAYSPKNNSFIGTAYDEKYRSYLVRIKKFNHSNPKIQKLELTSRLQYASQVEAIAWIDKNEIYISREASSKKIKGKKYDHKQKLFRIKIKD